MTKLFNDPARFTEDMLVGFLDANARYVVGVPGGVVRAHKTRPGKVAVVIGGGSGHYPAFCGTVGPGFADGAVVGNIFTSPSAEEATSVARAAHSDAGVLLTTGNYAGDVMNFGLAVTQLRSEGIEAHYFAVTDDVASAPKGEEAKRRGIAGDFTVFKCASAAAEEGLDLAGVVRVAEAANAATRTLGVAFDGCTLPGADHPLFTVPEGHMGLGLGIHGEPGVADEAMPTANELAATLVNGVLEDHFDARSQRIAVILNGLGRTKYEELFVVWGEAAQLLRERGYEIVEPEVGELVTSQSRHSLSADDGQIAGGIGADDGEWHCLAIGEGHGLGDLATVVGVGRGRCWPELIRTRSGGAPQHIISCGRCCMSFTRSSWLSSPAGSRWVYQPRGTLRVGDRPYTGRGRQVVDEPDRASLRRAGRSRGITQAAAEINAELRKPQLHQPLLVETAMGKQALALLAALDTASDQLRPVADRAELLDAAVTK